MSINFDEPVSDEVTDELKRMLGDQVVAQDEKTTLLTQLEDFTLLQRRMKKIANMANQPVVVEINDLGDIKTMSDGTRYKVTQAGWRKLGKDDD